ncbi:MAG: DUF2804 domain-containing protein [Clostridia bacterium]|nr:DUF2804 domain-containing protein [Clostridia bacterium]
MPAKQQRITAPCPLHDEQGHLACRGWATRLLPQYDRSRVAASGLRLKEWDYYYIGNDSFGLALTVADNGYMNLDSVSFLDFEKAAFTTQSRMKILPRRRGLPLTSERGDIHAKGKDYEITFLNDGKRRQLFGHMDHFGQDGTILFDVTLTDTPHDSMVIVTPFKDAPKAFYYNQKINCLRAEGRVQMGEKEYLFSPATAFAVLDWGRGVWTYENTWHWASASGIVEGHRFGFNLGYGFGDTSAATENMLFCDGLAHKLKDVTFHIPVKDGREDYLSPWTFTSSDDRLTLTFVPILDRCDRIDLKLLLSDQHQVFGRYSGRAVLDDGTVLSIKNLTGFAEKVHNKW